MIINKELCKKCGKCVTECSNKAIVRSVEGSYSIDQSLCTDCADCSDIECIRMCGSSAITREDGTIPAIDRTPRLLSNHVTYLMAIMGDRGNSGRFPTDNREWREFRKHISAAFTDPDFKIRITYGFDDICVGCPRKQEGCKELAGGYVFERLGIEPGAVLRLWDVVRLFEEKFSVPLLKQQGFDDEFINCIRTCVSPDAKFLTNEK